MRIGMLTTSYPRHEGDVAGAFVRSMARALAARGHALEVLAPAPRETSEAPPRDPGVSLRWIDYGPPALRRTFYGAGVPDNARHPLAWPGLATFPLALGREARARVGTWDALISHWALPSALVAGAVRARRPHLAVLHSADVHLLDRLPAKGRWADRVAASASELLFASAQHRDTFVDALPADRRAAIASRAHASAMGIDPALETRDRRTLRRELGFDRFTVLSLGRLVPIKGVGHAIDGLRGVEGVELVVAGDGPCRASLEAGGGARFLGRVTGLAKAELMRAADAFVLPSTPLPSGRTEGTPTTVLEAAQAGLPIVASEIGGLPEVLTHDRSALFVRPGDALGLRRAVRALAADRGLRQRLSRAARTAAKRYRWSELAPRIEALLEP